MEKDYNSILMSWRNEKRPQHFSQLLEVLFNAFDSSIKDKYLPTLIEIMHEIICNLELVNEFMEDEEFDLTLDNENLSNSEEPGIILGEKIADLLLNKLILPEKIDPTNDKWVKQLIELMLIMYDEGFSEDMSDIAVVFEKIGNYLVLQKRDEETVVLLNAMRERDYFDNYAYENSKETFDGLLYLALEKENDTLGCLVTEAFEDLCAMYEEGWEKFIPFMLQMHGDSIDDYDFDPEELDMNYLNAIRSTKYEKLILRESPSLDEDKEVNQELSLSAVNKISRSEKSESENNGYQKKTGNPSNKPKAGSSSKSYRPKGIKRHFYGLYKLINGKKK